MGASYASGVGEMNDKLRAALAEPEQEPVACIKTNGELMWLKKPEVIYNKPQPLYTARPRREWVWLTGYEIWTLHDSYPNPVEFAQAIEATLKDKNGG